LVTVSNPGFTGATISAAQGLNPALTCPDPKGEIVVWALSENSSNIVGSAMCSFSCGSSIVVPSSVLQQMPVSSSGNADLFYIFLPPNNNAGVTSAQFTASGLNLGLLYYADLYLVTGLTLAP
jgi:hypothetical protein